MISKDSDVYHMYTEEAAEYVYEIHQTLLALGSGEGAERTAPRAVRCADGLLGASLTVGEEGVAELARKIRDDLSSVRDDRIDVRRVELLLEAMESIARSLDGALGTANGGFRSTMLARRRAHEVYLALMRLEDEPDSNGAKEEIEFRLAEFRQQCEEIGLPALVQLADAVRLAVQTLAERPGRARQEAIGHVYQCLGLVTLLEAGNVAAIQPAVSEMNEILR